MMFRKYPKEKERRRYIRLDSVFPVEFALVDESSGFVSSWFQGFTNNIGKGGLCVSVNKLPQEILSLLKKPQVKFLLKIEIPLRKKPAQAKARLAWMKLIDEELNRYSFGLSYEEISKKDNRRIFHYCIVKKFSFPLIATTAVILLFSFTLSAYLNFKLLKTNRALVEQFVDILKKSSALRDEIQNLNKEKNELQLKLQDTQMSLKNLEEEKENILRLQKKRLLEEEQAKEKISQLLKRIKGLEEERDALKDKISSLEKKETQITENLFLLDKKRTDLEKVNVEKMYQWLKVHQNPRSGLIASYEGDKDLKDVSFLYDQALLAILYVRFSDFERAKKIFDFFKFKAKKQFGGFLNAYYTSDGQPAEYVIHSGPNIWLGIAISHYINKTNDKSYLSLLKEILDWVISLQNEDKEGGIRGGPQISWYSTEHNLDAYALFNMAYQLTGEEKYKEAREKIVNWLILHAYDRPEVPVKRGKGDSTIATDTYAWSIASLGPERLESMGMNPEAIVEFAEKYCGVEIELAGKEQEKIKVKGFDFAPSQHLGRGPVISCEWTSQMILTYKLMAKFYRKKEMPTKVNYYEKKAENYLNDLFKLIISSPSPVGWGESCLPYATEEFVDTGHGWVTPKGKTTGSVSSTVYALFAYYGFNPLEL